VKAQKEEAEKKAAQAAQAAKAAAQAAKSANPPAAAGSAPNPGGSGNGLQPQRGGIEAEAVEEVITMPRVTMSAISVGNRDIGPEIVQTECHQNRQWHLRFRQQQLRLWITRLNGVG